MSQPVQYNCRVNMQGGTYVVLPMRARDVRDKLISGVPEEDGFLFFYNDAREVDSAAALIKPDQVVSIVDLSPSPLLNG